MLVPDWPFNNNACFHQSNLDRSRTMWTLCDSLSHSWIALSTWKHTTWCTSQAATNSQRLTPDLFIVHSATAESQVKSSSWTISEQSHNITASLLASKQLLACICVTHLVSKCKKPGLILLGLAILHQSKPKTWQRENSPSEIHRTRAYLTRDLVLWSVPVIKLLYQITLCGTFWSMSSNQKCAFFTIVASGQSQITVAYNFYAILFVMMSAKMDDSCSLPHLNNCEIIWDDWAESASEPCRHWPSCLG